LAFSIYFLFLDDLDIITIINQKSKLSKLQAQRDLLAENLKETKNTLKRLKNLNYLESYARSQKFFKKDDEEIFVITFEEKKKK
jgi:cell division protein FtsB